MRKKNIYYELELFFKYIIFFLGVISSFVMTFIGCSSYPASRKYHYSEILFARMRWVFSSINFLIVVLAMAGQFDFFIKARNEPSLEYNFDHDKWHITTSTSFLTPGASGVVLVLIPFFCTFLSCIAFYKGQ